MGAACDACRTARICRKSGEKIPLLSARCSFTIIRGIPGAQDFKPGPDPQERENACLDAWGWKGSNNK